MSLDHLILSVRTVCVCVQPGGDEDDDDGGGWPHESRALVGVWWGGYTGGAAQSEEDTCHHLWTHQHPCYLSKLYQKYTIYTKI